MDEKESILIVDDDEGTCRILALIFGKKSYETESAGTGREAIEKAQRRFFNVVLLDIKLPDMEGTELLTLLKELHPDMAVIMITGHASIETAVKAMNRGASTYITKPLNMDEVMAVVRKALEKQRLVIKKRQADERLKKTTNDLKQTVERLKKANHKIWEQQKSVIKEERLKVLLQMAGATAHDLNQPLMTLLCSIELIEMNKDNHEKLADYMADIEKAGQRIADIVKKIQTIRYDETKPYVGTTSIINLDQEINILSVNNSADDFEMINTILKDNTQTIHVRANSIKDGMESLENGHFDIVLLDHVLPDGNSFDFLKVIGEKGLEIPVVVITGKRDELLASKVIRAGAYDFLPKHHITEETLYRSINNALEKYCLKREMKRSMEKMGEMGTRDELTGLYNRQYFMETLEREMAKARRYESNLGLCMIDPDHFRQINDAYGHTAGDMVLLDISKILSECTRQSDLVCRYGGKEFAVILPNTHPEKARVMCERFRELVAGHQFKSNVSQFHITVSVGITSYSSSRDQSAIKLVEVADQALYQAKEMGRNRIVENTGGKRQHRPRLGKILVSEGYMTEEQLDKGLSEQKLKFGEVLVQAGHITTQQLDRALDYQKNVFMKLGEILKEMGYITVEVINWALNRMKRKLGEILMEMGFLKDYELNRVLALQGGV